MRKNYLSVILVTITATVVLQYLIVHVADTHRSEPVDSIQDTATVRNLPPYDFKHPRHSEIIQYLLDAPWQNNEALPRPSESLVTRVEQSKNTVQTPISWVRQANTDLEGGRLAEAAVHLLDGIYRDRTLLAVIFQEIHGVAFPLAEKMLDSGDISQARELLSACALASGTPVAYLRSLMQQFSPEQATKLWPDEPYLVLVDFGKDEHARLLVSTDFQYRETLAWEIDNARGYKGDASLRITAGASERGGELVIGWHEQFLELTPGDSGIRAYVRAEVPEPVELTMHGTGVFGNGRAFERFLRIPVPEPLEDGWLRFDSALESPDLWRTFLYAFGWAAREVVTALDPPHIANALVRLNSIGLDLPPGQANTYWFDRVELYLPEDSWNAAPHIPKPSDFSWGWGRVTRDTGSDTLTEEEQEHFEALQAMGYVGAVSAAPDASGVVVHTPSKAHAGFNFYLSGHAPEISLIDMDGEVVHAWHCDFDSPEWPEHILPAAAMKGQHWRRAHLFPNGDVLALACGIVLVKMDKEGHLIWARTGGFHHDFQVLADGRIFILYHEWAPHPLAGFGEKTLVDYVMVLDESGQELQRVSLVRALENSMYAPMLQGRNFSGDLLHTNTLQVLDGQLSERAPAFRAGNVLVCMLRPSLVAVVDMEREDVVWGQAGQWLWPHDPQVTETGTMLIFDNMGPMWHPMARPASRILEFDPFTREILWEYTGSREHPFFSIMIGAVSRLPNDNILVADGISGRAFEVTREKEVVWEFWNPARSGENNELIANVFDVVRVAEEEVASWLE